MFEKAIGFLLDNACINIRYMIHRDILKVPANDRLMEKMQAEVLQQPTVRNRLKKQHPDGWLGHELHGSDGMDSHIDALLRLSVEPESPYIQKAINALLAPEIAQQHKNYFAAGDALDADGRGGNRSITALILSTVRFPQDKQPLADEIQLSFNHL